MGCGVVNHSTSLSLYSSQSIAITDFALGHIIGRGEYGIVRSATYQPKKLPIAMKQLPYHKILSHKLSFQLPFHELEILKLISYHPNIIQLKFAFHDNFNCYFAFDYMKGGDLRYHLKYHEKFSEYEVAYLIGSIGNALHYLHNKNILHRDIKPENILLDSFGRPYLTDFGISYSADIHEQHHPHHRHPLIPISTSSSGTRCYSAPEVFTSHHKHSYHADYWSLGMLMYELFFHERPFHDFCPSHYVQFVEIQYESLWNDLEHPSSSSSSRHEHTTLWESKHEINWKYYQDQPLQQSAFGSSELYLIELRNRQFMISSSSSSGSSKLSPSQSDHSSESFFQHQQQQQQLSQQLPLAYVIPIPRLTAMETELSESCLDVLTRLLDIRIPFRLGTQSSLWRDELLEHEWFAEHYITKEKIETGNLNPDFFPNEVQVSSQVFMEFPENLFHSEMFPMENVPVKLSSEIKEQLRSRFHYIAPNMRDSETALDTVGTLKSSTRNTQKQLPQQQQQQQQPSVSTPQPSQPPRVSFSSSSSAPPSPSIDPLRPSNPHFFFLNRFHSSLESFDEGDGGAATAEHSPSQQQQQGHHEEEHETPEAGFGGHSSPPHSNSLAFIHKPKFKNYSTLGMSLSADYPSAREGYSTSVPTSPPPTS
jgi:serine/threonine protein kinase